MTRKIAIVAVAVLMAGIVLSETGPSSPANSRGERRQRKRKQMTPEMQMKKFGGFITAPYDGRYCYIMNAQRRVPARVFDWAAVQFRQVLSLPIRLEECAQATSADVFSPVKTAWSGNRKTGAVVSVVDLPNWTSLLLAPENGWAQVNVAALAKDDPSNEVLETRVKKELWRAFVLLFGGGNSHIAGDLMRPINSLQDLDAFPNLAPGPEPFNAMLEGAKARGITVVFRTTYKNACEQGWAPAPTNEYQKAIWDKVHAAPKNPMKIEFDPKKGR